MGRGQTETTREIGLGLNWNRIGIELKTNPIPIAFEMGFVLMGRGEGV